MLQYSTLSMFKEDTIYYCLYTVPLRLHFLIILLSLILIIGAALTIQDYVSGLHDYSLIHGLQPIIHWSITFLSDLILCLLWLAILLLIDRFVHSSTFNGRFAALTPLFFITSLPFVYLLAKLFESPILGATGIVFILLVAHGLFIIRIVIEAFRSYHSIATVLRILRWVFVLIFPNVNVYTLILAVLRPHFCPYDDSTLQNQEEFADERYPHKVLIHVLIFLAQFLLYFTLLVFIDTCKLPYIGPRIRGRINAQEEDGDVAEERNRIDAMSAEDKQCEALVVKNLSKRYNFYSVPAVKRLTFAVPHRQCFGLLGFNGSGRFLLLDHQRLSFFFS